MKVTVKAGLIFAAIWIAVKMLFHFNGWVTREMLPISVMINILCLLISIAVGLYWAKRQDTEDSNALRDIKNGMASGMIYTVIVVGFIFFYYNSINPGYYEGQQLDLETKALQYINDPSNLEELKSQNEKYSVMSKEEIFEDQKMQISRWTSPSFNATISILAMLLLTTLNSIVVTVVYRKLIFRE